VSGGHHLRVDPPLLEGGLDVTGYISIPHPQTEAGCDAYSLGREKSSKLFKYWFVIFNF